MRNTFKTPELKLFDSMVQQNYRQYYTIIIKYQQSRSTIFRCVMDAFDRLKSQNQCLASTIKDDIEIDLKNVEVNNH